MTTFAPRVTIRTVNPGDRIADEPQTIDEKAKQLAVDVPDITGDRVKVPTYFIVEYPNGEKKALHHVRDAKEISDVIRAARLYEEDDDQLSVKHSGMMNLNMTSIILVGGLILLTSTMLLGLF